ncbi:MAG TPA: D-2-hydroxyacid dehydrogenase [Bacillales bacterium]|nr:D-2-hydroxyacid dehydrogenase [Bacillales bacterium]
MLVTTIDEYSERQWEQLKAAVPGSQVHLEPDLTNSRLALDRTEILVTYGFDVTEENLRRLPALKWVQVFQSGIEHVPVAALAERGILLTNVKGIHGVPMAEYVMSYVLYVTRDMKRFERDKQKRLWNRSDLVGEVKGKTMVIFGAGTIGMEVAKKAKAFGMRVIGVNTSGERREPFDEMVKLDEKLQVLSRGDFIVMLLPVTEETFHCIGADELRSMNREACLLNIGRGALVDTEALVDALRNRTIRGAALDVFEDDPLPPEHPLWTFDDVFLTPHLAAKTVNYLDRCLEKFAVNVDRYRNGEPLLNQVDEKKGY